MTAAEDFEERAKLLIGAFKKIGKPAEAVSKLKFFRAPGRTNIIGEHTDYNEGFVLPAAVDRDILMLAGPREDRKVILYSLNFPSRVVKFSLDGIRHKDRGEGGWGNYAKGVAFFIRKVLPEGKKLKGFTGVLHGNVPVGGGLSSSAALEVLIACAFNSFSDAGLGPVDMIKLSQKAENEFVGVSCGIMDQFVSMLGRQGHALFLDCRTLEYQHVPIPEDCELVVCNTGVKRKLWSTAYNERRAECARGVRLLKRFLPEIKALRDVSPDDFERYGSMLPNVIKKRCRHVISENERVLQAKKAFLDKNAQGAGRLMDESHESLRADYEVSCAELDAMAAIARKIKGVTGARMTGAGFGGCTVNLVEKKAVARLVAAVKREYPKRTGLKPEVYVCEAAEGAGELKLHGEKVQA